MFIPWVKFQTAVLGASTYNPRLQTDIIISLCAAKMQLWFNFYNAICFILRAIRLLRPWGVG